MAKRKREMDTPNAPSMPDSEDRAAMEVLDTQPSEPRTFPLSQPPPDRVPVFLHGPGYEWAVGYYHAAIGAWHVLLPHNNAVAGPTRPSPNSAWRWAWLGDPATFAPNLRG